jgi:hypothetical protein
MRTVRRGLVVALAGVLVAGVSQAAALSISAPTGWDGTNPFKCTLQHAGLGTAVPDPGADPYCVDFDKTHQNVTDLGIVDFISKEPARVAAALTKCFYFQSDHWRGSIVQSDGRTLLYTFDGHYFFDEARGDGGVFLSNVTLGGQSYDPSMLPLLPLELKPFFGPGRGGVITHNNIPARPDCVARANASPASIYSSPPAPPAVQPLTISLLPLLTLKLRIGPIVLG